MELHQADKADLSQTELRTLLRSMLQTANSDEAIDAIASLIVKLKTDNADLQARVSRLLRDSYGRKSEHVDVRQLQLLLGQELSTPVFTTDGTQFKYQEQPAPAPRKAFKRLGRKPLPADIERTTVPLDIAADEKICGNCQTELTHIGDDKSSVLDFEPGHFKVIEYLRAKYACKGCEEVVLRAPTANKPADGGLAGAGLLAHVVVSKFKDSLPLNRLSGIYARSGVEISKSTLCEWVAQADELLAPVVQVIEKKALSAHALQIDDTGLTVLDKTRPSGQKRGHIWCMLGDGKYARFAYTENWRGESARALLQTRVSGWLQADGYAGFDQLYGVDKLIEVGCWAHARRKYFDAFENKDVRAAHMLGLIGKLFDVEREGKEQGFDSEQRRTLREQRSVPVLTEIGTATAKYFNESPPKTPFGKALTYTVNQWKALNRFTEDGALELHNNAVERALRAVAIGRKNWMFAGSDSGAARAASMYTLLGTAVLCGCEPWEYLRDVIDKLSGRFPASRIDDLVPDRWLTLRSTNSN